GGGTVVVGGGTVGVGGGTVGVGGGTVGVGCTNWYGTRVICWVCGKTEPATGFCAATVPSLALSVVCSALPICTLPQPALSSVAWASAIFFPTTLGTPTLPVDTDSATVEPGATCEYGAGLWSTTVPAAAALSTSLRTSFKPSAEIAAAAWA